MGKRFGLGVTLLSVSVAGFAGVAWSGCTQEYNSTYIPPEDGGRTSKETGGGSTPDDNCPTTTTVNPDGLRWQRPTPPQPDKCQADDVAAMREYLTANPKATNEEFETFVKNRDNTCHDCVFGDAKAATWAPAPVEGGKVLTFNIGACYALVSGNEACGMAVQHNWDCEFQACEACGAPSDLEPCRAKARNGVCKAMYDGSRSACAGLPNNAEELCGSPFDSIRVQCVSSTLDAGKL